MLKNFFNITFRNLRKNRLYSIVNIAGLAIGISCSMLILLWVNREVSFDKFHPNHEQVFQVWMHAKYGEEISSWKSVPLPVHEALKNEHPAIQKVTVSDWGENHLLGIDERNINKKGYFVGSEFLSIFPFEIIKGAARDQVFSDPSSIILTESTARALFGDAEALDQTVTLDNESSLKVTAILADLPDNSSFTFDFLVPWSHYEQISSWVLENTDNWGNYSFQIYVELDDPGKKEQVESTIQDLLTRNGQIDSERSLFLLPLEDWRLRSTFANGVPDGGLIVYVRLFGLIAIFVLIIACINFMNLATARSERRAKEVGVRKSIGSSRWQLIVQFMGESLVIATIAYLLALLLTELFLPYYNDMLNNKLSIDYSSREFWILTIIVILFAGVISGSYPAFYLSSFNPVRTLKGAVHVGKNAGLPRKMLLTLQFVFAIFLLVSTLVIYKQIDLVRSRDLGYQKDNLILMEYSDQMHDNYNVMKQELLASGVVESVNKTNSPITNVNTNNFVHWPGKSDDEKVLFSTLATEYDFSQTMGVEMIMGRDFSEDFPADSTSIIVNKAALDLMNLENPLGTTLEVWEEKFTLIGVVDNFLTGSVFREVTPLFIVFDPEWAGYLTLRLSETDDLQASLKKVEGIINIYNSAYPFEYKFADDIFNEKFNTINLTQKLAGTFAVLALIITGMGLFGLASYTAQQRTREMGIRKVMGASITDLVSLMNKEFSLMVIISFVLAIPLAWWLLDSFLSQFDIRTNIPWWVYPVSGMIVLLFTIIIVTQQALKAAGTNPSQSLKEN